MARFKFLLAFLALLVCGGGVAGAYFYWKKFAQPEIVVNRHISGKGGGTLERPDLGKRHFDAAIALLKEGELVSARDRLLYLMQYFPESATYDEARRIVGEVNMDLLLSKIPMPGKVEHKVRRGEALRGWVMVGAEKLDGDSLVEAMLAGRFYASSGVTLDAIRHDPDKRTLALEIKPIDGVEYTIAFIGTRKGYDATAANTGIGEVFATVKGNTATFTYPEDALYVRATITSSRKHPNPSFEGQMEQAWIQPCLPGQ